MFQPYGSKLNLLLAFFATPCNKVPISKYYHKLFPVW